MIFTETSLPGACLIDIEPRGDARGFFARAFCEREFAAHGLETGFVNANLSFNAHRGTLRGMHFQREPHQEVKLVRCTRGAVYDVIVDLRPGSATRYRWLGVELTADNHRLLYVPAGFAHGYLTLQDGSEVFYHVSAHYAPHAEGGVRWDDPKVGIEWPRVPSLLSDRDHRWPLL